MPIELPSYRDINPGYVPGPPKNFEESPEIKEKLSADVKQNLEYIDRGDLGVPEHALRAAAFQYSAQCDKVNKEYMLCKKEEGDPRKCLKYINNVSICAENFYREITDACTESLVAFGQCLERKRTRRFVNCREYQLPFDTCLFEKLGFDKARYSMLPDATVQTDRPKPKNPYNFQPTLDNRRVPADDFYARPLGKNRDY